MEKVYGVVLAGGIGSRMGNAEKPKQFLELGDKPVIIHTIEKFVVHPGFEKVLVLAPQAWVSYTRDIVRKMIPLHEKIVVLAGGSTRNETIMNAIRYIEEQGNLDDETIIVTHDSVRPFVTHRILDENIEAAKQYGACDTVIPTPQSFRAKRLKEIYGALTEEEKAVLTDACKILVLKGEHVHLVQGEEFNIKITYPYDLVVAKTLLGLEE